MPSDMSATIKLIERNKMIIFVPLKPLFTNIATRGLADSSAKVTSFYSRQRRRSGAGCAHFRLPLFST